MAVRQCGGCAARRAAKAAKGEKYLWLPPAGSDLPPTEYDSELAAKAKVMRKGGTYKPLTG